MSTVIDKHQIIKHFDRVAASRPYWFHRNRLYHDQIAQLCRPFLDSDSRVLELGCSTGDLLGLIAPHYGVGVDISPRSINIARAQYPEYEWVLANAEELPEEPPFDRPFDIIVLSDITGYLTDIQEAFGNLKKLTHPRTRLVISHWNWIWEPALRLGESLHLKAPDLNVRANWLSPNALSNLLTLADYETLETVSGLLFPYNIPGITSLINSLSHAPLFDRLSLVRAVVARPKQSEPLPQPQPSVTVVIPTRNEAGNIARAIEQTPDMGSHTELLFVDGNSTDGTVEAIEEQIRTNPNRDIRLIHQVPQASDTGEPPDLMLKLGKGDAVRKAFAAAHGDILMILDSDLTVPPDELPKFYDALATGKGALINGSRMVYPQEQEAMRTANRIGNVFFSLAFTWLLGQPISDTLCGTKALLKQDYLKIVENRSYFGDFDPFGDFDLLFGAAWLNLPILDLPVHYRARTYGDSKVRVSLHGPLLGRMSLIAFLRFKIQPLFTNVKRGQSVSEQQASATSLRWPVVGSICGIATLLLWIGSLLFRPGSRE